MTTKTLDAPMSPEKQRIYEGVRNVLVDALGVDREEVTLDSTLQRDLGAESFDYLDIVFRLEKEFKIKIPKGEMFPDLTPDHLGADGRINNFGRKYVKEHFPHLGISDTGRFDISDSFKVRSVVDYLEAKFGSGVQKW